MEQRQQKSSLVLKYKKRRFDGGPEIELIRGIERQQAISQINRLHQPVPVELAASIQPKPAPLSMDTPQGAITPQPAATEQAGTKPGKSKVLEALILGPLEICVGVVGLMTAGLAIFTFHRLNNQPLLKQSQGVFKDCLGTLGKGLRDTLTTPWRVLQAVRQTQ